MRSTELQKALLTVALNQDHSNCLNITSDHQRNNIVTTLLDFADLWFDDGESLQSDKILELVIIRLGHTPAPNQLTESRRINFLERIWKFVCKSREQSTINLNQEK